MYGVRCGSKLVICIWTSKFSSIIVWKYQHFLTKLLLHLYQKISHLYIYICAGLFCLSFKPSSLSFIYLFIFMPIPCHIDCCIVVSLEVKQCYFSTFVHLLKIVLTTPDTLQFHMNFTISQFQEKKLMRIWDYVESIKENLTRLSLPILEYGMSLPLLSYL